MRRVGVLLLLVVGVALLAVRVLDISLWLVGGLFVLGGAIALVESWVRG